MGKFLPIESRPVEAFLWKSYYGNLVYDLISYLNGVGKDFELISFSGSTGVSILIGCDEDQIRVDEKEWVIFDGDSFYTLDEKNFQVKFRAGAS